jgi:hypothetical protein
MSKKDYQDFKIKINMKTILLFEEITNKSFNMLDNNDIITLIYCALVVNNDMVITLPFFKTIMKNEKIARDLMTKCQAELDFMLQFNQRKHEEEALGEETLKATKISDVIHMLILQYNLDIDYVMYKMRLWEVEPIIRAMQEKTKVDMVEKRFWAYLNICPHIDSKKIKGPEDFLPFPWEKESKKEASLKFMEENKEAIMAFFNKDKTEG